MVDGSTPDPEPGTFRFWLVRHGETDWSASGRHTGLTDLPLNDHGRAQARSIGRGLAALGINFTAAWVSPLKRARETAELAGFSDARVLDILREWDYGEYEGTRTDDVRREELDPKWLIWSATIRHGESVLNAGERADKAISTLLSWSPAGDIIVFSHGHFLRILAARWMGMLPAAGQHWALHTGTVSMLSHEHGYRVIARWNSPFYN